MRVTMWCLVLASACAAALLAAEPVRATDTADELLVDRFLSRDDQPLASYTGTRCLEATNQRFNVTGSMRVRVNLSPERGFEWTVLQEQGSGYIRNKVLRKALEGERDMVARGEPARAALSLDNYEMRLEPEDVTGDGLATARLLLVPRRADILLVRGSVLVTDPEADLLEVRGRLSKSPSWWTTRVDVVRTYERVAGVRVPVEMSSTAQVRIAGRSQFRMTSAFEQVNGRATGIAAAACTAKPGA